MRRTLLALAAILAVLLPGSPAWAHNQLIRSDPAADATLTTAPASVTLTFLERLNPDFTTIVVTDSTRRRLPTGVPTIDGARGTVEFTGLPANGAHTVAYRVVSVDGHAVQGSYGFTLADPHQPAAAASPAAAAATPGSSSRPSAAALPLAVPIGGGCLALALIAGAVYRRPRRRTSARAD